jgi:hypothetical protein
LSKNILSLSNNNIISALGGGLISFIIPYYFFHKSRIVELVKNKRDYVYIPLFQELSCNMRIIQKNYFIDIYGKGENYFSKNKAEEILSNKEFFLLPIHIRNWMYEYFEIFARYCNSFEYEYKTFKSFLKFLEKKYSIGIDDSYYTENFFIMCLKSIEKNDINEIDKVEITKTEKSILNNIEDEIFYWANNKYKDNEIMKSQKELTKSIIDLLNILDYLISKINKKYLKILEYV